MKSSQRITLALLVSLLSSSLVQGQQWKVPASSMMTKWGKEVTPNNAWQEYPRPQLMREAWQNLNGLWDLALTKKTQPQPKRFSEKILVPFCVESALSGVHKTVKEDDRMWYKRTFSIPAKWKGQSILLNFEAVDWSTTVWINGALVGSHKGGYDRFTFDITPYLSSKGQQEIIVAVEDPTSAGTQARGKQQIPQEGIFYTPVSGIWQTVWLEPVATTVWIEEVKITPDIDRRTVDITPMLQMPQKPGYEVKIAVMDGGKEIASTTLPADKTATLTINEPKLWSPDSPFLYDLSVTLVNKAGTTVDKVSSYFGMRKISLGDHAGTKYLFLNNKPLFQYGTLDQGWWPDGLHTPPSDEAMKYDIQITKDMGFNTIRKHIKVEPARWYYHCDKLGMLVWQDMPSGMVVVPGDEKNPKQIYPQYIGAGDADINRATAEGAQYEWELRRMIDLHYNASCIVTWVPFNEGWGQYDTERITHMIKEYDPSRLVNSVSGWSLRPCGDLYDYHTYGKEVNAPPLSLNMASVIGEYGGIGYPIEGHLWNPNMRNWGYQTYHLQEDLMTNYKYKLDQIIAMKAKGLSAAIYTQTTDVEGEVNGLLTYDREIIKIPAKTLKEWHAPLYEE